MTHRAPAQERIDYMSENRENFSNLITSKQVKQKEVSRAELDLILLDLLSQKWFALHQEHWFDPLV